MKRIWEDQFLYLVDFKCSFHFLSLISFTYTSKLLSKFYRFVFAPCYFPYRYPAEFIPSVWAHIGDEGVELESPGMSRRPFALTATSTAASLLAYVV